MNMEFRSEAPASEPRIIYFLQALGQRKARLGAKIARKRLTVERLPELGFQIVELARAHGRITSAQIVAVTGANRNTGEKAFADAGICQPPCPAR